MDDDLSDYRPELPRVFGPARGGRDRGAPVLVLPDLSRRTLDVTSPIMTDARGSYPKNDREFWARIYQEVWGDDETAPDRPDTVEGEGSAGG